MSMIPLVSGGLDSTLMCVLAAEEGIELFPLFIDYGQSAADRELAACRSILRQFSIPEPEIMDVSGYGKMLPCGLTSPEKDIFLDAFLPGRNMLFLLAGAAYAYQQQAAAVSIGLLSEETSLFPDQTRDFISRAESLLSYVMNRNTPIITPLIKMSKQDVVAMARSKGISGTWSCHSDKDQPCGRCIACREYKDTEV